MEGPSSDPPDDSTGETTIQTDYDWGQTSPRMAVLQTVPDAKNVRPADLPPLRSSIDPDALDALIKRAPAEPNGDGVQVNIWYADREVTIESDGSVVVTPRQKVD